MRIRLRGLNSITKRLADGSRRTYWYAWKGGPPLRGEPGTPEFIASYNEAVASKVTPPRGKLLSVLQAFQASDEFRGLAPRSRVDYVGKIKIIEKAFGDFPLSAMTDVRTRGIFKSWREQLAVASRRQADYAWVILARVLSWGWIAALSPPTRAPVVVGFIAVQARRISGPMRMRRRSSNVRPRICICRYCSHSGPASGKATYCGFRGRLMTECISGCGNQRAAREW